jgi:glycosyltransferase involved in cell wall biosynthesis
MPVIVKDFGGNYELTDNGVDTILVQPEKPQEMVDAIVKILQDK